ncbi:GGDEF domain-containing protein [Pyruvatibacter sp.]|uniref:GGDEF domain-containing protein n=1 Tax=Pyruvatibacter sp. TaxID=1981328 RepID=UPI0032ED511D
MSDTTDPKALAEKAMAELAQRALDPTPDNYELWYTVASGANPGLNREIEKLAETGTPLDDTSLKTVRSKYMSPAKSDSAILEMGGKLEDELSGVMQMLESATKDTGAYGASLSDVSAALDGERSPAEVRVLMETLVTATKTMESRSKQLEARLQESKAEVTQLRTNMEEIRTESLTDQLTGLANRRNFDETVAACMANATADGSAFTLVLGDIDHFKKFNDTYGHQTGDQVLKLVAQCMRHHVKDPLKPARYGGEEFALILPHTEITDGVKLADEVRRTIESKELVKKSTGENLGAVTMSFGVALFEPGESAGDLIKRADACLYSAKHAGRNQVKWEVSRDLEAIAS